MNDTGNDRRTFKKTDLIFFALALLPVLFFMFAPAKSDNDLTAVIKHKGEIVASVRLASLKEEKEIEAGPCTIVISKDGAYFKSSPCRAKICIRSGKITKAGDAAACIPMGVVVELKGEEKNLPVSY